MSGDRDSNDSAFSGRWVARIEGKIVGQGGTPEAASRAAGAHRHKETAEVSYLHAPWNPPAVDLIPKIVSLLPTGEIYLVGGAMRDSLLGKTSHDFDFAVSENAISLARKVARELDADFYVLDPEFDAARVIVAGGDGSRDVLDFAAIRGGSIQADLAARDFRINAIALNARDGTTLDPMQGAADLQAKVIRACSASAMKDDPIRILRAVRLAAALEFRIEAGTRQDIKAAAGLLPSVSAERTRDELFRILSGPRVGACLRALEMLGVVQHLLPELSGLKGLEQSSPHIHDVWDHTLSVIQHLEDLLDLLQSEKVPDANGLQASLLTLGLGRYRQRLTEYLSTGLNPDRPFRSLMQFTALYHDVGKGATQSRGPDGDVRFLGHAKEGAGLARERASQLHLSNAEVDWVQTSIANHMRFFFLASKMEMELEAPPRAAVYRFFRDTGSAAVGLIILGLADLLGTRDHLLTEKSWSLWVGVARELLENLWERPEQVVAPPRLLDGNDLMTELTLAPGPAIGQMLEAIREAQAAGEVRDRKQALAFARKWVITDRST